MSQDKGVCIRQTELPGVRPLFADLLYNFPKVADFYAHPPSLAAAQEAAKQVHLDPQHRADLVAELKRQNEGCGKETSANLERLAGPNTVVVATGQQVGVYGGPVFAVYKALTAVKFAEELTRRGTPAVPVFWLATEDHDIDEVDHSWTFDSNGRPVRLQAEAKGKSGAAVGGFSIADACLEDFEAAVAEQPFANEAIKIARDTYGDAPRFGQAFIALFRHLMCRFGLIFLCPMQPEIRRLASPLMAKAVEKTPELVEAVMARGVELERAGYHQQVHVDKETSLFFLFEDEARIALKRQNTGGYRVGATSYSTDELLARLAKAPLEFSPNALLRPVMQDYLLPTATLVGGPAELAYLGQSAVIYRELLGRMPVIMPRATFTVVDQSARKLLDRYGLSATDCMVPPAELQSTIADRLVPAQVKRTFQSSGEQVDRTLEQLSRRLQSFDPTLATSFAVSRRKIRYQLEKTEAKAAREMMRRDESAQRQATYLSNFLYPNRSPQERVYGPLPFLAKFGPQFIDRVAAAVSPDCVDHQVLNI